MFNRMVIGEALSEEQVKEFCRIYKDHLEELNTQDGYVAHSLLVEEGGNMMIAETTWATRDACLRYHSSRSYRQFVGKTQHLLAGQFVVKLFKVESANSQDGKALDIVQGILSGQEWSSDTAADIAETLTNFGRPIQDITEGEDEEIKE